MYRNRRPESRRDRRKSSRRARQRHEGTDKSLLITLGIFVVVAIILLVVFAVAMAPG